MKLNQLREDAYQEAVNTTSWLRKWLDDDEIDPYHWSWLIPTWSAEMDIDVGDEEGFESLEKAHQNGFKMWLQAQYDTGRLFNHGPEFDQANHYYSGGRVISANEWLIHFTPKAEDAFDIASKGFKIGVTDRNLHISANADKFEREVGEFAFAFRISGNDYERAARQKKYGMNAVVFQTESGVESYHVTDDENQVIFDKDKTRNRVPVYYNQSDGEWFIEDKRSGRELFQGEIREIVEWVKKNFTQYRKSLAHGAK